MNYAEVYIDIKNFEVSRPFDYIIPENLSSEIKTGSVVYVHFNNRKEVGYVTRVKNRTSVDPKDLKHIDEACSGFRLFDRTRLKLIFWMSTYFIQSVSKIINFFLPPVPADRLNKVLKKLPDRKTSLSGPAQKTHLVQNSCAENRFSSDNGYPDEIIDCMHKNKFRGFLIKNLNWTGKIDLLKKLCEASLPAGKTAIILSPETEDAGRIYDRLNIDFKDRICLYHSDKKQSEKKGIWFDIFFNEFGIIVGTRSAIFLPFSSPAALILDDAHSTSYKEATISRYDAARIALKLGRLFKIPVIFISSIPSIEMMFEFQKDEKLKTINVSDKDISIDLIERKFIDLKTIDRQREDVHITNELHQAIREDTGKGNRVLIFLNRRGYSSFLVCKGCGNIPKCPNCNISYTYHSTRNSLVCHHCSSSIDFSGSCSSCSGSDFSYKGVGIELFEDKLKKRFPDTPVFRIDSDILKTGKKNSGLMDRMIDTSPAILIGTQAITQNINFDNISLAAVPDFDSMFQIPDFHANERAFQTLYSLISMVQNNKDSRFLIQTFNTGNIVLESFVNSSYDDFYKKELINRKELFYPPYSNIINIIISGKKQETVKKDANNLFNKISEISNMEFLLLGPSPAPYYKINLFYRWHIIVKTNDIMRFNIRLFKIIRKFKKSESIKIVTDVDPVWIL